VRQAVLGFLVGAGLLTALASWLAPGNSVLAQHARAPASPDGDVIAVHWTAESKHQEMMVLIDPRRKAMSVYQIDRNTGAITLKSVRQCEHDLLLRGFNENRPLAEEIRGMANQR
jgi:hypothetical protein